MIRAIPDPMTQSLIWLWKALAFPFHSGRIAAIELAAERTFYERRARLQLRIRSLTALSATTHALEEQLANGLAEAQTDAARELLIAGFHAHIEALRSDPTASNATEQHGPQDRP